MIGYERRTQCAGCDGRQFDSILGLGIVPLAGYFPTKRELSKQSRYTLNLVVCKYCKLVQTDSVIDPALLFEDYRYLSSLRVDCWKMPISHSDGSTHMLYQRCGSQRN